MNFLAKLLQKEKKHFDLLHNQTQHLLVSIFLYALISPLFSLFVNAFLWRELQNFVTVALYNLAMYAVVPFGFYINGYLLKKYATNKLYLFGLLLEALATALLIFLTHITFLTVIIFGILQGFAISIYWANRNLLTLQTTKNDNRIYFSGIEITSSTITGIIIPFLIGNFIIFGTTISLYTPLVAYKILAVIMLVVSIFIGIHILGMAPTKNSFSSLWIHNASKRWQRFRWYEVCVGFFSGTTAFIPTIIVLVFVGNENALGNIQSISAITAAIIVYYLAKKLHVQHRLHLVITSVIISILGALAFSLLFSPLGVYLFFISTVVSLPILWIPLSSLNYDLIDEDEQSNLHYAYVCDQEIYLNLGRVLAIAIFIILIFVFSKTISLRFVPLFYAGIQILFFFIARSLERTKNKL